MAFDREIPFIVQLFADSKYSMRESEISSKLKINIDHWLDLYLLFDIIWDHKIKVSEHQHVKIGR